MISKLYAEAAGNVTEPSTGYIMLMNIMPFVLIFAIFYFLLIRPQRKKQQQHKAMIEAIKVGERVLLNSGFKGTVKTVKDDSFLVEIAEGVEVEVIKSSVMDLIKK